MQDYYVDSELYCKFDGQKIKMIKFARQNKQKCKREHKNILTTLSVTILKMDETEKKKQNNGLMRKGVYKGKHES